MTLAQWDKKSGRDDVVTIIMRGEGLGGGGGV